MDPKILDDYLNQLKMKIIKNGGIFQQKKLDNLKHLQYFHNMIKDYDVNAILAASVKNTLLADDNITYDNTLFYEPGTPNIQLFKFSPGGDYIFKNPRYHLWKECDIDYDILKKFDKLPNNRYTQTQRTIPVPDSYDLFPLALSAKKKNEFGIPKDEVVTRDAIRYATEKKRYTIFKESHLAVKGKTWHDFVKEGITSKYTIYAEDCNGDYLIDNADRVYSSESAMCFQAMLKGKIVATYHDTDSSEVMPIIKTASEIDDIEPLPIGKLYRYLSWYYHKLCINIYDENAEERINDRISRFINGERTKELFK